MKIQFKYLILNTLGEQKVRIIKHISYTSLSYFKTFCHSLANMIFNNHKSISSFIIFYVPNVLQYRPK